MKGTLPKYIAACQLACRECIHFNESDPDIYYCELNQEEFPGLCEKYEGKDIPDERNYFIGVNPL